MEKFKINFSFSDFLAYLFPGIAGLVGLWLIFHAIPAIPKWLVPIKFDIVTGTICIPLAYCLGTLLSSIASITYETDNNNEINEVENPLENHYLFDFKDILSKEFEKYFGSQNKWGVNQFYMILKIG